MPHPEVRTRSRAWPGTATRPVEPRAASYRQIVGVHARSKALMPSRCSAVIPVDALVRRMLAYSTLSAASTR
jgi:hypothetical protein